MKKIPLSYPNVLKSFHRSGKISTRFRNINVTLFAVISVLIVAVMYFVMQGITDTVSRDYAQLYSANTAGTLNAYFGERIALVAKAAHSKALMNWLDDEENQEKKLAAYEEMMEIIELLPSSNLYIGIDKSLHEFAVEEDFTINDIEPFATLDPKYRDDIWYFESIASDKDYILNVDKDKIMNRKRVWLNYNVIRDGDTLGVISTGLKFSELVEDIFSKYDNKSIRGLVIDENGIIHMDSSILRNDDFLHFIPEDECRIEDEFSDSSFISAVNAYIENIDGYFDLKSDTSVIELSTGQYRYATIAPIASTTWSVVTLYNSSALFNMVKLLPLFSIMLSMFVIFIIATSLASTKLIFAPFEKLMDSIMHVKVNMNERVYGTDRRDEIGHLANTVQNMKDSLIEALHKAHYDALTGIYNRRFMEENLERITKSILRSGGLLSVMMIDVDFFKKYNDAYGHSKGDACLKTVADTLAHSITRADDFVARYGGEEFIVVLKNTDENGARVIANRMLENVKACDIPHEASDVASRVTISIGITVGVVNHMRSGDDYIKRADEALYLSKESGRNKYTFLNME